MVYALHSLEYVLGLVRFRVFVPNLILYSYYKQKIRADLKWKKYDISENWKFVLHKNWKMDTIEQIRLLGIVGPLKGLGNA